MLHTEECVRYITSKWLKISALVKEKMAEAHKKHIRFTHNVIVHMTKLKEVKEIGTKMRKQISISQKYHFRIKSSQ
jgi:hypothetical protein